MKTFLFLFLLFSILLWASCNQNEYNDPNYPTIINGLPNQTLNQIADQLAQTSMAEYTVLDTFGIPYLAANYEDSLNTIDWRFSVTKEELAQLTKAAIVEYGFFMNSTDSSKINIRNISTTGGIKYTRFYEMYPDSLPPAWKITTNQQTYNGIDIRGTSLTLVLTPGGLVGCSGYWYNEVYIPDSMIYSEESAKELLMSKLLTYNRTEITPNELTSWHASKQVILPLRRFGKIELRVCWALYPDSWEVLIDHQTGDILSTVNISAL